LFSLVKQPSSHFGSCCGIPCVPKILSIWWYSFWTIARWVVPIIYTPDDRLFHNLSIRPISISKMIRCIMLSLYFLLFSFVIIWLWLLFFIYTFSLLSGIASSSSLLIFLCIVFFIFALIKTSIKHRLQGKTTISSFSSLIELQDYIKIGYNIIIIIIIFNI